MEGEFMVRIGNYSGTVAGVLTTCLFLSVSSGSAATQVVNSTETQEVVRYEKGDGSIKLSVGLGAGYMTGESRELVYWPEYGNHKASELIWKIDNVYMTNVNATLDIHDTFYIHLDGWFNIGDGDGTMDDYDWLTIGSDWTDWSHHDDTDVTTATIFDISGGWNAINKEKFTLSTLIGYKRDEFAWESYGGSYIYSTNGFRDDRGNFAAGQPGIGYEQTFTTLYFGIGLRFDLTEMVSVGGRVIYSPIVNAEAVDNHYQRNLVTYDDFSDGDLFGLDLSVLFNISEKVDLNVGYSYLNYDEMQGDSDWHYGSTVYSYSNGAGADHNSSLFTIKVQYTF